ncbi:MAG: alpha/beta fold hydrolase [Paludisphaera borealis]|uniref:alpha/beta fold hydrolase n=1 Tax=Paludisphaera borealis TaxID=1387353 RepID=UPI0028523058|nr:alpha/beta fold hydrolase [Paludisphaera borealis]MDR3618057.1 alpha/beta fold hydrolase [Paludisphaera borealis]
MTPIRRSRRNPASLALGLFLSLTAIIPGSPGQEPQAGEKLPAYPDHARLLVVRDASGAERPVESVADWAVRRGHVLGHLQEVMGPFPGPERRVDLDWKIRSSHKEKGYTRHKIDFQSEPGDRVPAWLLIPDSRAGEGAVKRPAMLCLHQTVAIGKDEPAGLGQNPNLDYGRELAERGYVTIAPDYPNFGEYQRDVYAMGYASASMKAIWNNTRAVDLLVSLPEVDPGRIGVVGHSLGGHNAIFTALFEPRIKAVVSSSSFNAFPYYYKGDIAGWSHKGYMPRLRDRYHLDLKQVPFDFPELIAALAPRPFFTNSPLHDDNFEVEGVRVCLTAARPVYRLFHAEDDLQAVHPDAEHSFPPTAREAAYEFLDRRLK